MGSPIPLCFLRMCRCTLQCLVGDNSSQLGQTHFVLNEYNHHGRHQCDTGVTPQLSKYLIRTEEYKHMFLASKSLVFIEYLMKRFYIFLLQNSSPYGAELLLICNSGGWRLVLIASTISVTRSSIR